MNKGATMVVDKHCYDYATRGTPEPVSEAVKRLEADKARVEKELADLKAKQAAEAKKKESAGSKLVNRLPEFCHNERGVDIAYWPFQRYSLNEFRINDFAAAIDKSIAEAVAEERERCVKACDAELKDLPNVVTCNTENSGRFNATRSIRKAICNLK